MPRYPCLSFWYVMPYIVFCRVGGMLLTHRDDTRTFRYSRTADCRGRHAATRDNRQVRQRERIHKTYSIAHMSTFFAMQRSLICVGIFWEAYFVELQVFQRVLQDSCAPFEKDHPTHNATKKNDIYETCLNIKRDKLVCLRPQFLELHQPTIAYAHHSHPPNSRVKLHLI